ncbi:MAG: YIP1 family protein, partial [Turicibacter sp.]
ESRLLSPDIVDIYVDELGIIYAASLSGSISVYTSEGDFIYVFGTSNKEADISGLNASLVSVATDSLGRVWTLDGDKAFIQSFDPTNYAKNTYEALSAYELGLYEEAVSIWNDVLGQNQMSVLAHSGIAKNYFSQQRYELAMEHSKIAGNRFYYSQAFWEVRNVQIQSYIAPALIILLVLFIGYSILKLVQRKYHIFDGVKEELRKIKAIKLIDDLLFMFKFFGKPLDSFYDLKRLRRGSNLGALIIFISTFVAYMWNLIGKGFIFQRVAVEDIDFNSVIIGFFSITLLFVICNYLVTSITDGEGNFSQIFRMLAYSFGPLLISLILGTILSHIVTFDEGFIINFIGSIGYLWTAVNILLGVQETHNYDTRVAIKSIAISIGFMLIIAVVLIVVILMSQQVYQFFEAIVKEVIRNVMA